MIGLIKKKLQEIKQGTQVPTEEFKKANAYYFDERCQILTQSRFRFDFVVDAEEEIMEVTLKIEEENIFPVIKDKHQNWDAYSIAALLELSEKMASMGALPGIVGRKYTRVGMTKRVLEERKQRALDAKYHIEWANNIYGQHILINEEDVEYKITLRDFDKEIGYVDSIDLRTNKLGTTKHIMFAFHQLKSDEKLFAKLEKEYPFIEIYLDPLNDYKISWFFPHELDASEKKLIKAYFGEGAAISENQTIEFLHFLNQVKDFERFLVRPEVTKKVEEAYNRQMLESLRKTSKPDFNVINANLFSYQMEGVEFALFREGTIIADEMGLGKTLQAITTAILKKQIFDFKRTLVICPASLKAQWKSEVEKFSDEKAIVVEGKPAERAEIYRTSDAYFLIINYETVLRDGLVINEFEPDFIILDEAQRIKNFATKTAQSIKRLKKKHNLVITGTPIENKLIDLYSIVQFVSPEFLTPLWEFSYQHCFFDESTKNKVTGYYNLQNLKARLQDILIRREKRNVIKQLPNLQQVTVPVNLHPAQADYHSGFARGIAAILAKKFKTQYDWQRLMLLLNSMRMTCNSTFLIDKKTNYSPKLSELRRILLGKLDLKNSKRKIIIFSEWIRSHQLISEVLRELDVGYVELSGKVPVKKRGKILQEFEENENCQVFLSTEAGGAGLNLQVADTVINFELPWNPAKKNQRIGRIDRLGQTAKKLTVLNFITRGSIEEKIAGGLMLKQNLFDGVLDTDSETDVVDFSEKGRAQFLKQLENTIAEFEDPFIDELVEEEAEETSEPEQVSDEIIEPNENEDVPLEPRKRRSATGQSSNGNGATHAKGITSMGNSTPAEEQQEKLEQMETVMNQGLQFLAGLYKMSTGQDIAAENQKVEIDKETGEVVMRFKLPF